MLGEVLRVMVELIHSGSPDPDGDSRHATKRCLVQQGRSPARQPRGLRVRTGPIGYSTKHHMVMMGAPHRSADAIGQPG
jgi:hypothetical protein